jgi:hypothetical protein
MPEHQGLHRKAYCLVTVNGHDVTSELRPYLISVRVVCTSSGGEYNRIDIELDDRNAELAIPPVRSLVQVHIGWAAVGPSNVTDIGSSAMNQVARAVPIPAGSERQLPYEGGMYLMATGWTLECESGGARSGGGRRLWITAYAPDIMGAGKSANSQSEGEGDKDDSGGGGQKIPFSDFAQKVFSGTGVNVQIQDAIGSIKRDAWQQAGESPFHWLQNMAKQIGGKVRAAPNDPNTLLVEKGYPAGDIDAWWGWNLIAWRLKPFVPRPQWSSAASNFFNIAQGGWSDIITSIAGSTPHANAGTGGFGQSGTVPGADVGGQSNEGAGAESSENRGRGWVMLNGEPAAINGGRVNIQGARPGVDGSWGIEEVEHTYSRRGYTTRCEVKDPAGMSAAYGQMGWKVDQRKGGETHSTPQTGDEPINQPETPPEASVSIDELEIITPTTQ